MMMRKVCSLLIVFLMIFSNIISMSCAKNRDDLFERTNKIYGFSKSTGNIIGELDRNIPEYQDAGLKRYPIYNQALSNANESEKESISKENAEMFDYDEIKADGSLYKKNISLDKKLFKHSASKGLYMGDIDDNQKAVAKKLVINPRRLGDNMTGLYAPPGEIITVILNSNDASRKMRLDIGQGSARGGSVQIPTSKAFTRMPSLKKSLILNNSINYVGSPLGGPIYLHNEGDTGFFKKKPYEVTIIGAIEMPHFIYESTKEKDWDRFKSSSAPVFDLEIEAGVRMTMPSAIIRDMSYQDVVNASTFWKNATDLSNKMSNGGWYLDHPITMIFDTYVPAGAAVAFVGADFCVLPIGWAKGSISYKTLVKNGGWGSLHEMNHHHQGWGAGNGGEVTNNVISSLTYMLYTDIAENRTEEGGLDGWNWVTSASHTLKLNNTAREKGTPNTDLDMYVTLAQAFGDEAMIEMAKNSSGANQNHTGWFMSAVQATNYDMSYYLKEMCNLQIDQSALDEVKSKNLPMFVPIANLYQTGRDILGKNQQKKNISMGKPFVIPYGRDKLIDLNKSMVLPQDITYTIKNIENPKYGKFEKISESQYQYSPDKEELIDELKITVSLKRKDSNMQIEDVTLILAFKQNLNYINGYTLENPGFSKIDDVFLEEEFDIKSGEEFISSYPGFNNNQKNITMVEGKIVVLEDRKYEIFIKGDDQVVLFGGFDKNNLEKKSQINSYINNYDASITSSFFEIELKANQPFYFKLYNLNIGGNGFAKIGWRDSLMDEGNTPNEASDQSDNRDKNLQIVDIPSNFVYHNDAKVFHRENGSEEISTPHQRTIKISETIENDISKATVVGPSLRETTFDMMFDKNPSTIMHTTVNLKFPLEFIITLPEEILMNNIKIFPRQDTTAGRLKEYELYVGESLSNLRLLKEDIAENSYNGLNLIFNEQKVKYIRLIAKSSHNQNYIAISEFIVGNGITSDKLISHNDYKINYKGKWEENNLGLFLNGGIATTKTGTLEYTFHGKNIGIFSMTSRDFGLVEIKIDDQDWQEFSLYNNTVEYRKLVYVKNDLSDGYHTVKIRPKNKSLINIDFIAINETEPLEKEKDPNLIFYVMIPVAAIIIVGSVILILKNKKRN